MCFRANRDFARLGNFSECQLRDAHSGDPCCLPSFDTSLVVSARLHERSTRRRDGVRSIDFVIVRSETSGTFPHHERRLRPPAPPSAPIRSSARSSKGYRRSCGRSDRVGPLFPPFDSIGPLQRRHVVIERKAVSAQWRQAARALVLRSRRGTGLLGTSYVSHPTPRVQEAKRGCGMAGPFRIVSDYFAWSRSSRQNNDILPEARDDFRTRGLIRLPPLPPRLMSSCPACVESYQRAKRECIDR